MNKKKYRGPKTFEKYKIDDILLHVKSKNEFVIKEFQDRGVLAEVYKCPISQKGLPCYISKQDLSQYEILDRTEKSN